MVITIAFPSACKTKYPPLRIGNSIGIKDMNYERLKAMKDAGIDCIEITTGGFISTKKPKTDAEITELLTRTKLAADSAGIEIWSIHMPFGKDIDISQTDEKIRKNSVALKYSNFVKSYNLKSFFSTQAGIWATTSGMNVSLS